MTHTSKIALAAVAVFGLGSAANAADAIVTAPPAAPMMTTPAPASDWTGFYGGANIGYLTTDDFDIDEEDDGSDSDEDEGSFGDLDNGFVGAQVGYNQQFGMFVLGAEADIQQSTAYAFDEDDVDAALNYYGTVRARAGVAFDAFMPYVTGGFAFGEATTYGNGGDDLDDDFDTEDLYGYTVGGGVEAAVTETVSIKAEYLYLDFEEESFGSTDSDVDLDAHTIKAGVNFRF